MSHGDSHQTTCIRGGGRREREREGGGKEVERMIDSMHKVLCLILKDKHHSG